MNYLHTAARETLHAILNHKIIFGLLIVLQLLIFTTIGLTTATYVGKVIEGTQGVLEQANTANVDPQKIQAGQPFLNDLTPIYKSYQMMKDNFIRWLEWIFLIVITLCASVWLVSHLLLAEKNNPSWKQKVKLYGKSWLRFTILVIIFAIILYFIFTIMIKAAFFNDPDQEHLIFRIKVALSITAMIYYFLLIFAAQLTAPTEKSFFKRSLSSGLLNIQYSLLVLFISWVAIYGAAALLGYVVQNISSFLLLFLTTLLFTTVIVLSRLFWIKTQQILSSSTEEQR